MATDNKLYCLDCRLGIWIGQSLGNSHTLYKDKFDDLKVFLFKHQFHKLKFSYDDDEEVEGFKII